MEKKNDLNEFKDNVQDKLDDDEDSFINEFKQTQEETLKDLKGFTKIVKGKGSNFILKNEDKDKDLEFEHVEGLDLKEEAEFALYEEFRDELKQKGYLQNIGE